jgi:hypothetical protein
MKSRRTIIKVSYLLSLVSYLFVFAIPAHAQTQVWSGINPKCVGPAAYARDVATIQGIECLVANLLSTAITIIGIAAFVMFLIGSFQWLTSGSNVKGVESGRNAISFAILGIVVALASFVILRFISEFTGIPTLLQFNTQLPP